MNQAKLINYQKLKMNIELTKLNRRLAARVRLSKYLIKKAAKWLPLFLILTSVAYAFEIDRTDAINAIVGEAAGEPYIGQVAVAEVIRNRARSGRGLKGVYGINAEHIKREPGSTFQRAARAWEESKQTELVKGATIWQSKKDLEITGFDKNQKLEFVTKIGGHYFFREK